MNYKEEISGLRNDMMNDKDKRDTQDDFLNFFLGVDVSSIPRLPTANSGTPGEPRQPSPSDAFKIPHDINPLDENSIYEYFENPQNQNIWILTVVSSKFREERKKSMLGFGSKWGIGSRSHYRRSFILYNLYSGKIIPCLMKSRPKVTCAEVEKDKGEFIIMPGEKSVTALKDARFINFDKYYYNIYGSKLFNYVKTNISTTQNKIEYVKRKGLLNIHLADLLRLLEDNPVTIKQNIQKEVIQLMNKINKDKYETVHDEYKSKTDEGKTEYHRTKIPLLKFGNKMKIKTNPRGWGIKPKENKGTLKEFRGLIDSNNIKINKIKTKQKNTEEILKKMKSDVRGADNIKIDIKWAFAK